MGDVCSSAVGERASGEGRCCRAASGSTTTRTTTTGALASSVLDRLAKGPKDPFRAAVGGSCWSVITACAGGSKRAVRRPALGAGADGAMGCAVAVGEARPSQGVRAHRHLHEHGALPSRCGSACASRGRSSVACSRGKPRRFASVADPAHETLSSETRRVARLAAGGTGVDRDRSSHERRGRMLTVQAGRELIS